MTSNIDFSITATSNSSVIEAGHKCLIHVRLNDKNKKNLCGSTNGTCSVKIKTIDEDPVVEVEFDCVIDIHISDSITLKLNEYFNDSATGTILIQSHTFDNAEILQMQILRDKIAKIDDCCVKCKGNCKCQQEHST